MSLDPERLAADVVNVVKGAITPLGARVADLESKMAALLLPEPDGAEEALVGSFTGLLQKELAALLPIRTVKRIERNPDGQIAAVVEDQT